MTAKKIVTFRLPLDTLARVDAARGDATRTAVVTAALEAFLEGAPTSTAPAEPSPVCRHPKAGLIRHSWGSVCGSCGVKV